MPSEAYIHLQFLPSRKNSKIAERYTGRLNVKRMVQQRQWRKNHIDSHYGACIFRYLRECALMLNKFATLVCVDNKHRVKILPVAYVQWWQTRHTWWLVVLLMVPISLTVMEKVLTRDQFVDASLYSGHSFRIGAATTEASQGIPDSLTRAHGAHTPCTCTLQLDSVQRH